MTAEEKQEFPQEEEQEILQEEEQESPPEVRKMTPEEIQQLFRKGKLIGSILLLIIAIGITGYYILFPSRGYFHSDTTDTIMWAEASYDSGSLFNPDFEYACLLPFGTSLIMTALIPITGVSMTTHVLGMLIFCLLFTGGLILMLRNMDWKPGWIAAAVFTELMLCSGSEKLREIYWGHTIYYSLGVLFIFIGLSLVFRLVEYLEDEQWNSSRKKAIGYLIALDVWCILTGSDQITSITIFILPMLGAVFCYYWMDNKTKILSARNLRAGLMVLMILIGMVTGYLLTNMFAGDIVAAYENAYSGYSPMSEWADNFRKFPMAWISLLGVDVPLDKSLMSVESVKSLLKVITGLLMLILPVIALLNWNKIQEAKLKILILTYWFMTMLVMMGYIMGKLSAADWRLSPIVGMSAIVSVAFLQWGCRQIEWQRISSLLVIPVILVSVLNAGTMISMPADNTSDNRLYALVDRLEELDLTYGYATFWQANSITIISNSRVKCRSVEIGESGLWMRYYQANKHWYEDQPGQDRYFMLLEDNEAVQLKVANDPRALEPHEECDAGDFEIWIYTKNPLS